MKKFNHMALTSGRFLQTPGLYIPINEKTLKIDGINSQGMLQANSFLPVDSIPLCNVANGVIYITATVLNVAFRIFRDGVSRYLYLNSTHTGYVVSSILPSGFYVESAYECILYDSTSPAYAYLNSTYNGITVSTTEPSWLTVSSTVRNNLVLVRDSITKYLKINSTLNGLKVVSTL